MKHLPKHLRPRWRYLGVGLETWPDVEIPRTRFETALQGAARTLLGDTGAAEVDISVLAYEMTDGLGHCVVRVRREEVERGRAALACLDTVSGHPIGVHVRGVSGTVRACEEKYIGGPLEPPTETRVAFDGADRRAVVRNDRVDVRVDGGFAGATEFDFD